MNFKLKNHSVVFKGLKKLKDNARNTKPLMLEIAEDMKSKVNFRFRLSKDVNGNSFEPLSKSTVANRRKGSKKPLSDTGALKNSMSSTATNTTATVGTNLPYAATMNYGAKKGEYGTKPVSQNVKSFTRKRNGKSEKVSAYTRSTKVTTPWGDIPKREFIGFSKSQINSYRAKINKYLKEV